LPCKENLGKESLGKERLADASLAFSKTWEKEPFAHCEVKLHDASQNFVLQGRKRIDS
jgi:hypothetical protein